MRIIVSISICNRLLLMRRSFIIKSVFPFCLWYRLKVVIILICLWYKFTYLRFILLFMLIMSIRLTLILLLLLLIFDNDRNMFTLLKCSILFSNIALSWLEFLRLQTFNRGRRCVVYYLWILFIYHELFLILLEQVWIIF